MRRLFTLAIFLCLSFNLFSQATIIGHNVINYTALTGCKIIVKQAAVVTQTFDTKNKSDFRINLDFGLNYRFYFVHPTIPVMYMEVIADDVPPEKHEYRMVYELYVPLVNKKDEDI